MSEVRYTISSTGDGGLPLRHHRARRPDRAPDHSTLARAPMAIPHEIPLASGGPSETAAHDVPPRPTLVSTPSPHDRTGAGPRIPIPATRPHSAHHVGTLWWSARKQLASIRDRLFLSVDPSRRAYLLWLERANNTRGETRLLAFMRRRGLDARTAASALLLTAYGTEGPHRARRCLAWSAGLLAADDLVAALERLGLHHAREPRRAARVDRRPNGTGVPGWNRARILNAVETLESAALMLRQRLLRQFGGATRTAGARELLRAANALEECVEALLSRRAHTPAGIVLTVGAARTALEALSDRVRQRGGKRRRIKWAGFEPTEAILLELIKMGTRLEPPRLPDSEAQDQGMNWPAWVASTSGRKRNWWDWASGESALSELPGVKAVSAYLERLREVADGPNAIGELVLFPCPEEFYYERLDGRIGARRFEALADGARPTPRELRLWRRIWMNEYHEGGPARTALFWRHRDEHGTPLVWAELCVCRGEVSERIGPHRTRRAVETHLRMFGRLKDLW